MTGVQTCALPISGKVKKDITVHIVSPEDYDKAAVAVLIKYLDRYYTEVENSKGEKVNLYKFGNAFIMPTQNAYFNCDYIYALSNGYTSVGSSDYFEHLTESKAKIPFVLVNLNSEIEYMTITASSKNATDSYESFKLDVAGESSSNIDDNHSYALSILSKKFGNEVVIKDNEPNLTGYTKVDLLTDPTVEGYSRLKSISYDLINNYEGTYQIVDKQENAQQYKELIVVGTDNSAPYLGQTVFLVATFTFQDDSTVDIQLPIVFHPQADAGDSNFERFMPYYVYFNNNFIRSSNNNFTIDSFSIPLEYNNGYPTYLLKIYDAETGKEVIYGNGTETGEDRKLFNITLTGAEDHSSFQRGATTNIGINKLLIARETKSY